MSLFFSILMDYLPMSFDPGHWECGAMPNPQKYHGFIYLILNKLDGRYYVGRKSYRGGKPWRSYTGSCKPLNEDIAKLGKENFEFIMLMELETKAGMNYIEERLQYIFDVLHDDKWYNRNIGGKRFGNEECYQEHTKDKLQSVISRIHDDIL